MSRIVALGLVLCCVLFFSASASPDSISAWNSLCDKYSFASYPAPTSATFESAYYGADFATDFASITREMNRILVSEVPVTPPGDDFLNISVQNWDL